MDTQDQQSAFESQHVDEQTPQKKKRNGPYRGPSRALKYNKLRLKQPQKVKVDLPQELGTVVGDKALQFVGECSAWVKEMCPLDVECWAEIPKEILSQLYGRIKSKFELPDGAYVDDAIKTQCADLYRAWRERLKAKYFTPMKTLKEAENACPPGVKLQQWRWLVYVYWNSDKQRARSEINRRNALRQKIHSTCGAKSIPRIIHSMGLQQQVQQETDAQGTDNQATGTGEAATDEPVYIKLFTRTKRHSTGFDKESEEKLQEFQNLHEKQIQEKGVDNLTYVEAFSTVLGQRSSYATGLGKGHPVLPKEKKRNREAELEAEIERMRADAQRKEEEAREREAKREEEAREREAKREEEAREREAKLRADLELQMERKFQEMLERLEGKKKPKRRTR